MPHTAETEAELRKLNEAVRQLSAGLAPRQAEVRPSGHLTREQADEFRAAAQRILPAKVSG